MWSRKNRFERGIASLESGTATAVEDLAATVRERFDNQAGQQLASNLTRLAQNIDQIEVGDALARRRKEIERATKKANRRVNRAIKDLEKTRRKVAHDASALAAKVGESVEQGGQQLATIGQKTVPSEPSGWVMPTLLGFLLGFSVGFVVARGRRAQREGERSPG